MQRLGVVLAAVLFSGCPALFDTEGRYQLMETGEKLIAWRLDTATGEVCVFVYLAPTIFDDPNAPPQRRLERLECAR